MAAPRPPLSTGFTRWNGRLRSVTLEGEERDGMSYLHRSASPEGFSLSRAFDESPASICCPDFQSGHAMSADQKREEEWSPSWPIYGFDRIAAKNATTVLSAGPFHANLRPKLPRRTNARDCVLLIPRKASQGGNAPQADMDRRAIFSRLALLRLRMDIQSFGATVRPLAS